MNTPNQESIKLSSPADDDSLGYGHLIGIVLKRWPWMLGAISISLIGALAIAITEESVYLSSMQLIVEPNFESRIDLENLDTPLGGKINDVDYATQLNVMRSEHFLAEALKRIERDYPNLTIKQVSKNFQLIQVTEKDTATRIFAASYEANNAKLTRDFLEALKTVYLEYNQRQQQERLSRGLDYINRQLESTRISLQSSQAALERFREQAKIVDPSTQAQKEIESLNSVTTEKQKIQADIAETQSKYQFLLKQLQLSPDKALIASRLSQSGKIQELLKQLQTTELELAERRTLFTEADPTLKLLVKKQQNQQQILEATVREITKNSSKNLAINSFADLQLGETDLSLISELLITNTNLQGLNARLLKINKFENELKTKIGEYPKLIAEYDRLQPEVDIERATLQRLLTEREQLTSELAKGGYIWQIVEEPDLGKDISVTLQKRLSLGLIFGLFLGSVLIFLQESTDIILRNIRSIQKQVPFAFLGTLPMIKEDKKRTFFKKKNRLEPYPHLSLTGGEIDLTTWSIFRPILEQKFQESIDIISSILLTSIPLLSLNQDACKIIAITSSLTGEGKTTITWGLGYSLARMNQRVLVIDTNLRNSGFASNSDGESLKSLSIYLNNGGDLPIYLTHLSDVNIDFIPAGISVPDPLALLSSPRFQELLSKCRQLYDVILVDTSPLLGIADTLRVSNLCDSIVLVTRLGQITQTDLSISISNLDSFNVLGFIANGEQTK